MMSDEIMNLQPEKTETTPTSTSTNTLPPPTPVLKVATTGRDGIFALLFLLAGIIWVDFSLYGGFELGYAISTVILGGLVLVYPTAEHRLSLFGTLYATCAIAISITFFMYTSALSKVLLFFWSLLLMGLAIVNNTKIASRGWLQLIEALRQILMTPFERCGNMFASLFQEKGDNSKKKAKGILIGVACLTTAVALGSFFRAGANILLVDAIFVLAGLGWATINVNSYPMVVELASCGNVGKYTGFYYTASMAAQTVTPMLSGFFMDTFGMRTLFPYAAIFVGLSFVTMLFVRHGDSRPVSKKPSIEDLDVD